MKFAVVKASGLSSTAAECVCGFCMQNERQCKVYEAMEHAQAIRESVEKIAQTKDRALLSSLGFECSESEDQLSTESEDDCDNFVTLATKVCLLLKVVT